MDIVETYERALAETARIVGGIGEDQLTLPTPCTEWNVRTVICHLIQGNRNMAAVLQGQPRQPHPIADVSGDPIDAYLQSAETVRRAWRERGRLDESYATPFGSLPAAAMLTLRLADMVTHGWDLAKATGQTPGYDDDVVRVAIQFAEQRLSGENRPARAFAPVVPVPEDLPAIDRLAALTGRRP